MVEGEWSGRYFYGTDIDQKDGEMLIHFSSDYGKLLNYIMIATRNTEYLLAVQMKSIPFVSKVQFQRLVKSFLQRHTRISIAIAGVILGA